MDEMPAHPFEVDARRAAIAVSMASLICRRQRARRTDRRRLARRIEDRQRQQAQIDADGGEQRDQVAAGDRLAACRCAPTAALPPENT